MLNKVDCPKCHAVKASVFLYPLPILVHLEDSLLLKNKSLYIISSKHLLQNLVNWPESDRVRPCFLFNTVRGKSNNLFNF